MKNFIMRLSLVSFHLKISLLFLNSSDHIDQSELKNNKHRRILITHPSCDTSFDTSRILDSECELSAIISVKKLRELEVALDLKISRYELRTPINLLMADKRISDVVTEYVFLVARVPFDFGLLGFLLRPRCVHLGK